MGKAAYHKETRSGIKWNIANKFTHQVGNLLFTIFLARLLSPNDFGLIAMLTVLFGFLRTILNLGLNAALIQKDELDSSIVSTVFWTQTGLGLLLSLGIVFSASGIATFYGAVELSRITYFLAIAFFLESLGIAQLALLSRKLAFRKIFYLRFVPMLLAGVIAVYLASTGYSYWSLVAQQLIYHGLLSFLLWTWSGWKPSWQFSSIALRQLFTFSGPVFLNALANYWVRNIDKVLIGKSFGGTQLGFYEKGYGIMLQPLRNVTGAVSEVLFPTLSKLQHDNAVARPLFLFWIRIIAFFTFPAMLILSISAKPFVLLILGDQWEGSIPVLQVLALVGMIQSISGLYGSVYLAKGATSLQLKLGLVLKMQTIVWIIVGLQWGIVGVAKAYLLAVLVNQVPHIYFSGQLLGISILEFIGNLAPILLCSTLMAGILYLINDWYLQECSAHFIQLFSAGLLGLILYLLFTKLHPSDILSDITQLIRR